MTHLRLAVRTMAKQPAMAALAITALALGIGLTTTMFSIVNGAVLRGLPFPESQNILHVAPFNIADQDDEEMRVHAFVEVARRQRSFEQLAALLLRHSQRGGIRRGARALPGGVGHRQHVPPPAHRAGARPRFPRRREPTGCRTSRHHRRQGLAGAVFIDRRPLLVSPCASTGR